MQFQVGDIFHIYNRGNNQQKIFFNDDNYRFFLKKISKEILPHCDILAYCMMRNHFHLLVHIKPAVKPNALNYGIAILLRSYTRAIQNQEKISGSLFQQKTKSKELNEPANSTMNQ